MSKPTNTPALGTVYWEDEPERIRKVHRFCSVCRPEGGDEKDVMIVSRVGVAHESGGYGVTDCGRDASGPEWWWRL